MDALIKQERLAERYRWELKKTGQTLEEEAKKMERLRRENAEMKKFIQANYKVAEKPSILKKGGQSYNEKSTKSPERLKQMQMPK